MQQAEVNPKMDTLRQHLLALAKCKDPDSERHVGKKVPIREQPAQRRVNRECVVPKEGISGYRVVSLYVYHHLITQ